MRIISGKAKGKKIQIPIDKKTRPLKDMVRESIFNIIQHSNLLSSGFDELIILDLFSGVGSFGLEAISRGAKKVIFFEDYNPALKMLYQNIDNLGFSGKAEIYKKNIYNEKAFKQLKYKFDIIFLDPPFKDEKINDILNYINQEKIYHENSLIIFHSHKRSNIKLFKRFNIIREEIYGSSKIIFGFFIF